MSVKLVRLLVVAIALVVPIQGVAAVTGGICMALGHHQGAAADHELSGHAEKGHDGHDHATHSHADEAGSKAAAADTSDSQVAHCGPCTACCASPSIASPAVFSILSLPSQVPYFFSQFAPLGVEPHGDDRPPLAL